MTISPSDRTAATKHKIETREARIGIIGMGYVGLPLALLFSEERFSVTGFDIDSSKVDTLNRGDSYIVRITGTEIQSAHKHGFIATSDYNRIAQMDVVIICVPTPLSKYHEPDLSYVTSTVKASRPTSRTGSSLSLRAPHIRALRKKSLSRCWNRAIRPACMWRATISARVSMSPSLPSAKILVILLSRGAIFPRWWGVADRLRGIWRRPFMQPSSTAPFPSLLPRSRR